MDRADFTSYPLEHVHRLIEPGPVLLVSTSTANGPT
jgi:hypothetical protein